MSASPRHNIIKSTQPPRSAVSPKKYAKSPIDEKTVRKIQSYGIIQSSFFINQLSITINISILIVKKYSVKNRNIY